MKKQGISYQCISCERYQGGFTCQAFPFPERIPQEILDGTVDHSKPYKGDKGLQWIALDIKKNPK